jgi:protein dpy-30
VLVELAIMTEANSTSQDPPAGGLDLPPLKLPSENESFPGENRLTDDEKNRWLILHFALPRTIMTQDMEEGLTTEEELNNVLASMAWGTIDRGTSEFILESEDPTLDAPHSSVISYAEYMDRTYPVDPQMDEEVRAENLRMARQKKITCTHPGEPVAKFKPMFDQVVKNLVHSNKALAKAFDIKKFILNENDVPEDAEAEAELDDQHIILRYGRYQVIPAFFNLLIQLTKERRRFSIVFRTYNADQLPSIQRELKLFCEGRHPAYSGQNKTQKPPLMSGDKLSRDMRLADENIGRVSRMSGRLEFPNRQADTVSTEPVIGEDGLPVQPGFEPTVYEFPSYHQAYEGLMHHVLTKSNTAAIVDDYEYWKEKDKAAAAGKLFLVNHGGGLAETKVQHIFFDGHIQAGNAHSVDVRDVVNGDSVPFAEADDVFIHRVDFYQACLDSEYFVKALKNCETKMSKAILESRRVGDDIVAGEEQKETLKGLPPKEYLYRTVIPALLPALEACQRDRPADPIEFIAFYMLRHTHQYSKTLKA